MKKFITITTLLVSIVSFAQTSIRVINLDVKMGAAEEVAGLFGRAWCRFKK